MKTARATKVVTISLAPDLYVSARKVADAEGFEHSFSAFVARLLRKMTSEKEQEQRETERETVDCDHYGEHAS